MTGDVEARAVHDWPGDRSIDLALARVHLRTGSLGLARAELEALAGSAGLDDEGLLDLAEARWRTGDMPGAGDAANAYLASGGTAPLGLVIAAEATAAAGRPGEARTLVGRALERKDGPIESLFAGMPRHSIWPADTAAAGAGETAGRTATESSTGGAGESGAADGDSDGNATLDARSQLELGRAALGVGRPDAAAVHFAIAMRVSPALAPVVLDALGEERAPLIEIVRGDAYRLVGRESRAARAWADAATAAAATADPDTVTLEPTAADDDPADHSQQEDT